MSRRHVATRIALAVALSSPLLAATPADDDAKGAADAAGATQPDPDIAQAPPTAFVYPCEDYRKGIRGKGDFGVKITRTGTVFSGSYHLAEDVWLRAGTEVRAVADGVVRYSDFSPTWKDDRGNVHWNLGNVIVIEHTLEPGDDELRAVCSFYVHLAADRKVAEGDRVERGHVIGAIGADRSEENGLYPEHLHFGLHRGPYHQISPAWKRELETEARTTGLRFGPGGVVRGEIDIEKLDDTSVLVRAKGTKQSVVLSLLVGSTSPGYQPVDIMGWCQGYGDRETVQEWLRPSTWIAARLPKE